MNVNVMKELSMGRSEVELFGTQSCITPVAPVRDRVRLWPPAIASRVTIANKQIGGKITTLRESWGLWIVLFNFCCCWEGRARR